MQIGRSWWQQNSLLGKRSAPHSRSLMRDVCDLSYLTNNGPVLYEDGSSSALSILLRHLAPVCDQLTWQ